MASQKNNNPMEEELIKKNNFPSIPSYRSLCWIEELSTEEPLQIQFLLFECTLDQKQLERALLVN